MTMSKIAPIVLDYLNKIDQNLVLASVIAVGS